MPPPPEPAQPSELVAELHRRQGEMYAGGPVEPVLELLAPDVAWHVPGASPIAGTHRGRDQVSAYFELRRQLASGTMRMYPGELLAAGEGVAQFVSGSAEVGGERVRWQTVGVYRTELSRRWIREAWLVPLDSALFDRIWSRRSPA